MKILIRKVNGAHERTLEKFEKAKIDISPIPVIIIPQEKLQKIRLVERDKLGSKYSNNSFNYTLGLYSGIFGNIFLDYDTSKTAHPLKLEKILSHEYAHGIYQKYVNAIQESQKIYDSQKREILTGKKEKNPLQLLIDYLENLAKINPTKRETRRQEFDNYFEEIFAESVAIYLNPSSKLDERWQNYSIQMKKNIVNEDDNFIEGIEYVLKELIFERLYTVGLKQVVKEAPLIYGFARNFLEEKNKKLLAM